MRLADVPHPDSAVCSSALGVCAEFSSPALVNHCRRSYVWAAAYAVEHGIAFDAELLYVSAMLHDIGLVDAFDNHSVPFENLGGHFDIEEAVGLVEGLDGFAVAVQVVAVEAPVRDHVRDLSSKLARDRKLLPDTDRSPTKLRRRRAGIATRTRVGARHLACVTPARTPEHLQHRRAVEAFHDKVISPTTGVGGMPEH